MSIRILAIGKKHENWVGDGIARYEQRLRKPFDVTWQLLPHSAREGEAARAEESDRILSKLDRDAFVVLIDDNVESLEATATTLAAFGCQVLQARSGADAVERLRPATRAWAERFDWKIVAEDYRAMYCDVLARG